MNEQEQVGDICHHRIILSLLQEEPVNDWREWTREVMSDLVDYGKKKFVPPLQNVPVFRFSRLEECH